jgi:hypothetical protein
MRDTLITLAGAFLSFFLLVSLMSPQQEQRLVSWPTTEDEGKHGFKAVYRWLAENNVNTYSLRKPVTRIDQEALPSSGNLMIISLPLDRKALDSEWLALNRWVSDGNAVLVLASMYHIPQWGEGHEWARESEIIDVIEDMTAEEFILQREDIEDSETEFDLTDMREAIQTFKPSSYRLYPAIEHALFNEIAELESWHTPGVYQYKDEIEDIQSAYWSIDSESSRLALRLMSGESTELTAMWLLPVGRGWIYLSAFPDLVSNSVLKQQHNARWFANLLAHTVAENGYVIFNDYHFGLSELYDPEAFFADKRLHNSLLFIGAFWLIYALGRSPRLAPVKRRHRRPATTDFIEAMAGFFTRRIKPRAIAKKLAERLLEDISKQTQLEGESLWNWLDDHPEISERDLRRLQRANSNVSGKTKLIQLTRSIERIHRVLS